ncbi:hypothetical protein GR140_02500 [Pseudomonas putida]|uniref:hypothetical protein n=1 Tax=Pseudomonas putida TaxID=303 RepID=UPI001BAEE2FC|nr:hypothetical protein [Pseudomonas putida]QUG87670.1 hypothetical protein GR140_02500 [Pseudomonas putida]
MINASEDFIKNYPMIFAQSRENPLGVHYWGIECGSGWFGLLEALCERVQAHVDHQKIEQVVFKQVKEKFGDLRIYYSGGDEYISAVIDMAEAFSAIVCENCGAPGIKQRLKGGWIKTVCQACSGEFESRV